MDLIQFLEKKIDKNTPNNWKNTFEQTLFHLITHDEDFLKKIKLTLIDPDEVNITNNGDIYSDYNIIKTKEQFFNLMSKKLNRLVKDKNIACLKLINSWRLRGNTNTLRELVLKRDKENNRITRTNKTGIIENVNLAILFAYYILTTKGRYDKKNKQMIYEATTTEFRDLFYKLYYNYIYFDSNYTRYYKEDRKYRRFYSFVRSLEKLNVIKFLSYMRVNQKYTIKMDIDMFNNLYKFAYWDTIRQTIKFVKISWWLERKIKTLDEWKEIVDLSENKISCIISKIYIDFAFILMEPFTEVEKLFESVLNNVKNNIKSDSTNFYRTVKLWKDIKKEFFKQSGRYKYRLKTLILYDHNYNKKYQKISRFDVFGQLFANIDKLLKFSFQSYHRLKTLIKRLLFDAIFTLKKFVSIFKYMLKFNKFPSSQYI